MLTGPLAPDATKTLWFHRGTKNLPLQETVLWSAIGSDVFTSSCSMLAFYCLQNATCKLKLSLRKLYFMDFFKNSPIKKQSQRTGSGLATCEGHRERTDGLNWTT